MKLLVNIDQFKLDPAVPKRLIPPPTTLSVDLIITGAAPAPRTWSVAAGEENPIPTLPAEVTTKGLETDGLI